MSRAFSGEGQGCVPVAGVSPWWLAAEPLRRAAPFLQAWHLHRKKHRGWNKGDTTGITHLARVQHSASRRTLLQHGQRSEELLDRAVRKLNAAALIHGDDACQAQQLEVPDGLGIV